MPPEAPLCAHCHLRPVQWDDSHGKAREGWRRYCSRSCSGKAKSTTGHLADYNRDRSRQFYRLLIEDVMGTRWRSGQPATVDQLVRLVRAGRRSGYEAAHHIEWRQRRKVA
jgi:hypothetical protein